MAFTRFAIGGCCDCEPAGCNATINVGGCADLPLPGATVSIAGVGTATTNGSGVATIALPEAGTYSVSVSFTGMTTVTVSHTFACPGTALNVGLSPTTEFGCCNEFALPLPLTLFASTCGAMLTMPATISSGFIQNWIGSGTVTTANVAVFPEGECSEWDGLSTTTGVVAITVTIGCGAASGSPPMLSEVQLGAVVNETVNFNVAFCPASSGCCGETTLEYDDLCTTSSSALAGTRGPTVAASGSLGAFFNEHSAPNNCGSTGLSCGSDIEVSS